MIPFGRLATVRGSLRRCAHAAMLEGYDDAKSEERETGGKGYVGGESPLPAGLSQVNLNCGGRRRGGQQPFRGRCPPTGRSHRCKNLRLSPRTCTAWRTGWVSAGWKRWSWSPPGVYWIPLFGCAGRARLPGDAGGPTAHQECVRSEDRRAGLPVVAATPHLRSALRSLPSRGRDPTPAQLPAPAGPCWWSTPLTTSSTCRRRSPR